VCGRKRRIETMNATVAYNTTSAGLTGITNLAAQSGTIGTIFGATLLVGLVIGVVASAHSWNTKGWLYKLAKWLLQNVGENVMYGIGTSAVIGSVYYVGSEISKFGESNPHFLYDLGIFCGEAILVVAGLAILGYISKPVWHFAADYASGKEERKVKKC